MGFPKMWLGITLLLTGNSVAVPAGVAEPGFCWNAAGSTAFYCLGLGCCKCQVGRGKLGLVLVNVELTASPCIRLLLCKPANLTQGLA